MTDVRLTALNPEDSKVYPVACNTSGELKLEKQATFDGNLNGDLTVTGTATFARTADTDHGYYFNLDGSSGYRDSAGEAFALNIDTNFARLTTARDRLSFASATKTYEFATDLGANLQIVGSESKNGLSYGGATGAGSYGIFHTSSKTVSLKNINGEIRLSTSGNLSVIKDEDTIFVLPGYTQPSSSTGSITATAFHALTAGSITRGATIDLAMQSDDPAAFTITYCTDEQGNQVENKTYVGNSENLLDIVRELRAANTALETRLAVLEGA
jgi:hypothetical protein